MGTTDQRRKAAHERGTDDTDETDEEQRQISGGSFICHSLSPFYQWNQCHPWLLASLFCLRGSEFAFFSRTRDSSQIPAVDEDVIVIGLGHRGWGRAYWRGPFEERKTLTMNYFSRLTDIVTCNLNEILAREADPQAALQKIITEMEAGLAGARRAVATAAANEERLGKELAELGQQAEQLTEEARNGLRADDESAARLALLRKQEVVDVVGGLEQQLKAAHATREHLTTTLRALEARLSEARRRQLELEASPKARVGSSKTGGAAGEDDPRAQEIETELEALRRELGQV
jgi:phage shock protein A